MSTETKWTPGPWFKDEQGRIWRRDPKELYENGGTVAGEKLLATVHVGWCGSGEQGFPVLANATLIKEAPELYKALEALTGVVQSDPFLRYSEDSLYGKAIKAAIAVLKKARGE